MGRFRPIVLTVALATVTVAGCFNTAGSAKAFETITAPTWDAGYSWTYDVTSVEENSQIEAGKSHGTTKTDHARATMTVFNTTASLAGEPVYYVRMDPASVSPFGDGTIQALSQTDLSIAGVGYAAHPKSGETPEPAACVPSSPVSPQPTDERFPGIAFPLHTGQKWDGQFSPAGGDGGPILGYHGRAIAMEDVRVPAGTFKAVHLRTDFSPIVEGLSTDEIPFKYIARADLWYDPTVSYLVKIILNVQGSYTDPQSNNGASFAYTHTSVLSSYSLTVGADAPAPVLSVPNDAAPVQYRQYGIVTDTEFPTNVALEPTNATFRLVDDPDFTYFHGQARHDNQTPTAVIDPTQYNVTWQLRYPDSNAYAVGWGDNVTIELTEGGSYTLQAQVSTGTCGRVSNTVANAVFHTYWQRDFYMSGSLGVQRIDTVGMFPVSPRATSGLATWTMIPSLVTSLDKGKPVFVDPTGRIDSRSYSSKQIQFSPYVEGLWTLKWDTEGTTVGDSAAITLRIDYADEPFYFQ